MLAFLYSLSSIVLPMEEKWQLLHLWKVPNNLKHFQKNPLKQLHTKKQFSPVHTDDLCQ